MASLSRRAILQSMIDEFKALQQELRKGLEAGDTDSKAFSAGLLRLTQLKTKIESMAEEINREPPPERCLSMLA